MIGAILATDEKLGLGYKNALPWPRNQEDMNWFRRITIDTVVVMGRKTWESIGSKNLPNRINVVLTTAAAQQSPASKVDGEPHLVMTGDIGDVLLELQNAYPNKIIWIIGGSTVFKQSIPYIDRLCLTTIPGVYECDTRLDQEDIDNFPTIEYIEIIDNIRFDIRSK